MERLFQQLYSRIYLAKFGPSSTTQQRHHRRMAQRWVPLMNMMQLLRLPCMHSITPPRVECVYLAESQLASVFSVEVEM